jgi:hypothetical protein
MRRDRGAPQGLSVVAVRRAFARPHRRGPGLAPVCGGIAEPRKGIGARRANPRRDGPFHDERQNERVARSAAAACLIKPTAPSPRSTVMSGAEQRPGSITLRVIGAFRGATAGGPAWRGRWAANNYDQMSSSVCHPLRGAAGTMMAESNH